MDPRLSISSLHLERKKPDQTLDDIGGSNPRLIAAVLVCSLTWAVGAMQVMMSAFTSRTIPCHNCSSPSSSEFVFDDNSAFLSEWGTSFFMVGNMIGGATLTHCADRFGRRPLILICLIIQIFGAFGAALSPNIYFFSFFRLVHGAFYTGSTMTGWVAAYEHSSTSFRQATTLIFGLAWVVGYCAVAPIAMVVFPWRGLIAIAAAPILAVFLLGLCLVPETLHFLVEKKKADNVVKWMKKVNKERLADVAMLLKSEEEVFKVVEKKTVGQQCWEHKIFIGYCLIQLYLWTCDNFIYFGLSLYSTQLAGNIYVNYLTMGLIEIPAYILTPYLLEKLGRRKVVCVTHLIAAFSFIASVVFKGEIWMLFCWLVGKLAISCSFMSLFVFASEMFPTEIRSVSVGLCAVLSKIGAILAPYIGLLGTMSPILPPLVLSSMSALAGVLTLLLPETKNKPLPTSITDPLSN